LFLILILIQSCVGIRIDDGIDLENNYRIPQSIIRHDTDRYEDVYEIIPPIVLFYQSDNRYIIAISREIDKITGWKEGNSIKYWIIDKQAKETLIVPMGSLDFYKTLEEKKIKLCFENQKDIKNNVLSSTFSDKKNEIQLILNNDSSFVLRDNFKRIYYQGK